MSETVTGRYEEILEELEDAEDDEAVTINVAQLRVLLKAAIFVKGLNKKADTYN